MKNIIYDKIYKEQEKYTELYGDKTVVFFQIGSFYETYSKKNKGYQHLEDLEKLLNIQYSKRDSDEFKKPSQFGIPCVSMDKHMTTMVNNGYTIVLFDQVSIGNGKFDRECTGVYSQGTYISEKQILDNNYILSAYICEEKQLRSEIILLAIGVTIIDVGTGKSIIHEFSSNKLDERFGLDEMIRIMHIFKPIESIFYLNTINNDEKTIKDIKKYLEIEKYANCNFYIYYNNKGTDKLDLLNKTIFKIHYQNDYLSQIYGFNYQSKLNGKKSPIEKLKMEKYPYSIISLIILLQYLSKYNVRLLKNLSPPEIYLLNKHLMLCNDAVDQLNIVDANKLEYYNPKFKSVFDVINKTSTPMGRRFLKENLLNPYSQENKDIIQKRYNIIDELLKNDFYKLLHEKFKKVNDIERMHRKIAMGTISPYDFYRLDIFYKSINEVIKMIHKNKSLNKLFENTEFNDFYEFQTEYNKEYNFKKLQKYHNFNDIDECIFNSSIHNKIDNIQSKINWSNELITCIRMFLAKLISDTYSDVIIKVENNEREGYYFTVTKTNEQKLKTAIKNYNKSIYIRLSNEDKIKISKEDIIFKNLPKGRSKIFISSLQQYTIKLSQYITRLSKLTKIQFIDSMTNYYSKYKLTMHEITKFISELDFLVSGAIVASDYYYCKPIIPSKDKCKSYIQVSGLRHVIIERLCEDIEYIPNDIELGNIPGCDTKNGILLYGINSCGKSSLIKSIGIAIILAQIGYYVPAESFIYEPYLALYARITGNDNIYKGYSSFELELTELDSILVRNINGENILVIGDEICRSTENISGIGIVSSALISLSNCNASFIFSSHLHDIPQISEVKELTNLRYYYLLAEYDQEKKCLIFNRKLKEGTGPEVYGIEVAKKIIKNTTFISQAENIVNRLIKKDTIFIPKKTSNYNKNLLVKQCAICQYFPTKKHHKELETHHINFQKDCSNKKINIKKYLHQDQLYNLVVLCRNCHTNVHQEKITINGYIDTSDGPVIDYFHNKKINKLNC